MSVKIIQLLLIKDKKGASTWKLQNNDNGKVVKTIYVMAPDGINVRKFSDGHLSLFYKNKPLALETNEKREPCVKNDSINVNLLGDKMRRLTKDEREELYDRIAKAMMKNFDEITEHSQPYISLSLSDDNIPFPKSYKASEGEFVDELYGDYADVKCGYGVSLCFSKTDEEDEDYCERTDEMDIEDVEDSLLITITGAAEHHKGLHIRPKKACYAVTFVTTVLVASDNIFVGDPSESEKDVSLEFYDDDWNELVSKALKIIETTGDNVDSIHRIE